MERQRLGKHRLGKHSSQLSAFPASAASTPRNSKAVSQMPKNINFSIGDNPTGGYPTGPYVYGPVHKLGMRATCFGWGYPPRGIPLTAILIGAN